MSSPPFLLTDRLWYSNVHQSADLIEKSKFRGRTTKELQNTPFGRFAGTPFDLNPLVSQIKGVSYGLIIDRAAPLGELSRRKNPGESNPRVFCLITLEELWNGYEKQDFKNCVNAHLVENGYVVKLIHAPNGQITHLLVDGSVIEKDAKISAIGLCTFLPHHTIEEEFGAGSEWRSRFNVGFKVTALKWSKLSSRFGLKKNDPNSEIEGSVRLGLMDPEHYDQVLKSFMLVKQNLLNSTQTQCPTESTPLIQTARKTSQCCTIL